jgi:hypothetical protein
MTNNFELSHISEQNGSFLRFHIPNCGVNCQEGPKNLKNKSYPGFFSTLLLLACSSSLYCTERLYSKSGPSMNLTQLHEEESSRSIIQCRFLQLVFHTMEPHVVLVWAALMLMCEHFWRGKWQTNHGVPEEWRQHQFIVYSVCFSQGGRSVSTACSKCSNFRRSCS